MSVSIINLRIGNSFIAKHITAGLKELFILRDNTAPAIVQIEKIDWEYLQQERSVDAARLVFFTMMRNQICNVKGRSYGQASME